jgi:hypothetical protein
MRRQDGSEMRRRAPRRDFHGVIDRDPVAPRNLEPHAIAALAWQSSRDAFVEGIDTACLIVRLDDESSELAEVLRAADPSVTAPIAPTLGYETRTSNSIPLRRRTTGAFGAPHLEVRLARGAHFVVPIRKRPEAGKAFIERVSIGRARNNDVVFRHESVSKFHAWLRKDDEGAYFFGDASSRNGTRINGEPLAANQPRRLEPGDEIVMGAVEVIFVPSTVLWDAIRNGG